LNREGREARKEDAKRNIELNGFPFVTFFAFFVSLRFKRGGITVGA